MNTTIQIDGYFDGEYPYHNPVSIIIHENTIHEIYEGWEHKFDNSRLRNYGKNSFLMPGIIDAHMHLSWNTDSHSAEIIHAALPDLLKHTHNNVLLAARAGITGMRDLGDIHNIVDQVKQKLTLSDPWVQSSGSPLTTYRGHCWFLGGEVHTTAEIKNLIMRNAEAGADWIKVMVTGGFTTSGADPSQAQFDTELLTTIVDIAHHYNLPVAAHAHAIAGIKSSIDAHVDSIEHFSFLGKNGIDLDENLVEQIAHQGIHCCYTIPVSDSSNHDIVMKKYLDLETIIQAGVKVSFASDSGINANKPANILPHNLVYATNRGVKTLDLLRGVTSIAAQCCKKLAKGYIKKGFDADFIILQDSPINKLENTLNPIDIYIEGHCL